MMEFDEHFRWGLPDDEWAVGESRLKRWAKLNVHNLLATVVLMGGGVAMLFVGPVFWVWVASYSAYHNCRLPHRRMWCANNSGLRNTPKITKGPGDSEEPSEFPSGDSPDDSDEPSEVSSGDDKTLE